MVIDLHWASLQAHQLENDVHGLKDANCRLKSQHTTCRANVCGLQMGRLAHHLVTCYGSYGVHVMVSG